MVGELTKHITEFSSGRRRVRAMAPASGEHTCPAAPPLQVQRDGACTGGGQSGRLCGETDKGLVGQTTAESLAHACEMDMGEAGIVLGGILTVIAKAAFPSFTCNHFLSNGVGPSGKYSKVLS